MYVTDTVAVLKCEVYIFVVLGSGIMVMEAIDTEGKGRFMGQHICHWRTIGAEKINSEVECRSNDEISPSSANLHKVIPPASVLPLPLVKCVEVRKIAFV